MAQFEHFPIDHEALLAFLAGLICLVACLASFALLIRARAGGTRAASLATMRPIAEWDGRAP